MGEKTYRKPHGKNQGYWLTLYRPVVYYPGNTISYPRRLKPRQQKPASHNFFNWGFATTIDSSITSETFEIDFLVPTYDYPRPIFTLLGSEINAFG
jgi:hypothetical protein